MRPPRMIYPTSSSASPSNGTTCQPFIPGPPQCRRLIGVGQVVASNAIEAQLEPDGAVELVWVGGPSWHVGESGRSALAPLSKQGRGLVGSFAWNPPPRVRGW